MNNIEVVYRVNSAYRPFFTDAPETQKPIVLLIGSRNSGKSRALAQKDVFDMMRRRMRIAYVRKVADSIRDSMYKEFRDVVSMYGLQDQFEFLVNPLMIRCSNGSEIICKGCDDPEKLKSLAEVDRVRIEELSELNADDFNIIRYGVRGESDHLKQIVGSMNPKKCFVKDYFFQPDGETLKNPDNVYYLHTTWRDNKFRGAQWDVDMEELQDQNETLWKMVSEGLWSDLEGLVYRYEAVDSTPTGARLHRRGLDFGGNDPSALLDVYFYEGEFWVDELIYESGLNTDTLPERMKAAYWETRNVKTLCDSAYKMQIDALYGRGWNVHSCEKPKVEDSCMWLSGFKINITRRSVNVLREIESYVWSKDRMNRPLNVPVAYNDHAMDAMRYAAIDLMPYTSGVSRALEYHGGGGRLVFDGGDDE